MKRVKNISSKYSITRVIIMIEWEYIIRITKRYYYEINVK